MDGVIAVSKTIGKEVADNVGKSETGQKIKSNKNYEDAKKIGGGALHAVVGIYDGMYFVDFTLF